MLSDKVWKRELIKAMSCVATEGEVTVLWITVGEKK